MRGRPPLVSRLLARGSVGLVAGLLLASACSDPASPPATRAPLGRPSLATAAPREATQASADSISRAVRAVHMPHGTVVDPVFASTDPASPNYVVVRDYTDQGDAALWTGHYLAAEALRYEVTGSAEALGNARAALAGVTSLIDATNCQKRDLLARIRVPASTPWPTLANDRESMYSTTCGGEAYRWKGKTSRDQYSGVFFGLAVAYDAIPDAAVRDEIRSDVTRLLDYLLRNAWGVIMPEGTVSTTFVGRADQQLAFLQVGRRVNPARFDATYRSYRSRTASLVGPPILAECSDPHGSYFKFNLDYINLYNLVRLEEATSSYRAAYVIAYRTLRGCTAAHQNAYFNMIDRALQGPSAARDADTRAFLGLWLLRPRRNVRVDLTAEYQAAGQVCGGRACAPVPVDRRPTTDFLWQRSPFTLSGGGTGEVGAPGLDYLLPYWMARKYGVVVR